MTKAELCALVAEQSGLTKKDTLEILNLTLDSITDALVRGERVQLVGFGSFEVKDRSPRTGRNFATGEATHVPASRAVQFRASNNLKDAVK
jgi:DNA-binding protein HU-beta